MPRGHGGVYDAVNSGEVVIARLRLAVDAVPPRPWDDGRIRLACDVSTGCGRTRRSARSGCSATIPRGKGSAADPGLAVPVVVALEPGRTSWTLPLDAVRSARR